jgi:hypothetical protein
MNKHKYNKRFIKYDSDDFILVDTRTGERVEEPDIVYAKSSIVEMINDGFKLEDHEHFVSLKEFEKGNKNFLTAA